MRQQSHGAGLGKTFVSRKLVAVTGGDIGYQRVLTIGFGAGYKAQLLPQPGTPAIGDHQTTSGQFLLCAILTDGHPDTASHGLHAFHLSRRLPAYSGIKQSPHQAQAHPAVVCHITQGILAVFVGMQAGGTKTAPVRNMNVADRDGVLRQLPPQPQLLKDQAGAPGQCRRPAVIAGLVILRQRLW